jgi:hypothetical protein
LIPVPETSMAMRRGLGMPVVMDRGFDSRASPNRGNR